MKVSAMPACCTATVVHDFGESIVADGGNHEVTSKDINEYLSLVEMRMQPIHAMIIVTTNNEQVTTNAVLKERGYISSPWMSKGQHPQTKVRLWYKNLRPFED